MYTIHKVFFLNKYTIRITIKQHDNGAIILHFYIRYFGSIHIMSYWKKRRKVKEEVLDIIEDIASNSDSEINTSFVGGNDDNSSGDDKDRSFGGDPEDGSGDNLNQDDNLRRTFEDSLSSDELEYSSDDMDSREATDDEYENNTTDDDDDHPVQADLREQLRACVSQNHLSHTAIRQILSIFQPLHPELPKDPRTLLETTKTFDITEYENGSTFYYIGIEGNLLRLLKNVKKLRKCETLSLQFNVDGLPLFKSSNIQLWPILCRVKNIATPFVIALFCGSKKPDVEPYLRQLVQELKDLLSEGVVYDKQYKVEVSCFICDAPAKCFIKQVKQYSGYEGKL